MALLKLAAVRWQCTSVRKCALYQKALLRLAAIRWQCALLLKHACLLNSLAQANCHSLALSLRISINVGAATAAATMAAKQVGHAGIEQRAAH
eukprot:2699671-Alexandrium_andersonii.AAC.1